VALRVPADQDRLSDFITHNFGVFFTDHFSRRAVSQHLRAVNRSLRRHTVLDHVSDSALRVHRVVVLCVHNPYALLGMLGGWTALSAACVGLLTSARRDKVFGATAAYAAVLVVVVSGTLGGAPGNYVIVGNCTCAPG
jgi:hypothetical protein